MIKRRSLINDNILKIHKKVRKEIILLCWFQVIQEKLAKKLRIHVSLLHAKILENALRTTHNLSASVLPVMQETDASIRQTFAPSPLAKTEFASPKLTATNAFVVQVTFLIFLFSLPLFFQNINPFLNFLEIFSY